MVTLDTDEVTIRVPTVMQLIRDLKGKLFRPLNSCFQGTATKFP